MDTRFNVRVMVMVALAVVAVVALAATAIAAPGGNGKGKGNNGNGQPGTDPSPSPSPTATATDEPPPPPSSTVNDADVEFVRMMIPHHNQALIMSRMAPDSTTNPDVVALAGRIDVEQTVEIGGMQNWQERNGLQVTDPDAAYMMMMQNPMMIEMMGMATQAELDELETLSGAAFDRLFLRLMIDHHQGAIDMILDVELNGNEPYLDQMALDMLSAQQVQIDMMNAMLDDLG